MNIKYRQFRVLPPDAHDSVSSSVPLGGIGSVRQGETGMTLVEVMFAIVLVVISFQAILTGYVQSGRRAEWSGYALAAQALGVQKLEQAKAAVWDNSLGKNEVTNLNLIAWKYNTTTKIGSGYSWSVLDLPINGTNTTTATNFVTIKMLYLNSQTNPPVEVQLVSVETVWPFSTPKGTRYYTNRSYTYCAPDNRDASSL